MSIKFTSKTKYLLKLVLPFVLILQWTMPTLEKKRNIHINFSDIIIEKCNDPEHSHPPLSQKETPEDYVIGTGKEHSVEEFAKNAFAHVGLNYKDHIIIDEKLKRPAEVDTLLADYTKAKKDLNWNPKISFNDLVINMVENDLKLQGK